MTTPTAKLINLTPHVVNISVACVGDDGSTINVGLPIDPSDDGPARVSETRTHLEGFRLYGDEGVYIPVSSPTFGEVTGLPHPVEGVVYIVSALVRAALPHRADLASPGPLVRDPNGQPIGCLGLTMGGDPPPPPPSPTAAAAAVAKVRGIAEHLLLVGRHDGDASAIHMGEDLLTQLAAVAAAVEAAVEAAVAADRKVVVEFLDRLAVEDGSWDVKYAADALRAGHDRADA